MSEEGGFGDSASVHAAQEIAEDSVSGFGGGEDYGEGGEDYDELDYYDYEDEKDYEDEDEEEEGGTAAADSGTSTSTVQL